MRTGDHWDPAIDGELRRSDILIVLFTPSWIQPDFCRKEYLVFEVEAAYGGGGYDLPNAISICIDPVSGKTGFAELASPPATNENRLSRIATIRA